MQHSPVFSTIQPIGCDSTSASGSRKAESQASDGSARRRKQKPQVGEEPLDEKDRRNASPSRSQRHCRRTRERRWNNSYCKNTKSGRTPAAARVVRTIIATRTALAKCPSENWPSWLKKNGSNSRSQFRTLANAAANLRKCRAVCRRLNYLCNINDLLADQGGLELAVRF